uniref:EGF-like domain-containing protein n=1 Tax=Ascaris lumbricoides TaxID=6252 RepID=A0A9J2P557_ASCLU
MNLTQYFSQQLYLLAIVIYCSSGDPNATQNARTLKEAFIKDSPAPDVSSDVHRPTPTLYFTKNANLEHKLRSSVTDEHELPVGSNCFNHGSWIASLDRCDCPVTYGGRFCEVHLCLNGGFLAEDGHSCHCGKFEGKHCEQPACVGGMLNVNGKCDCIGNYFGRFCELFCVHGRLIDGRCICYDGTCYCY